MPTPKHLIQKYNIPGPRYTSYPTPPYWEEQRFLVDDYLTGMNEVLTDGVFSMKNEAKQISIYIHLPFCESLCTFCACNKRITKKHDQETAYIDAVLSEWSMLLAHLPNGLEIKEIHLGGGTPTFFAPEQLKRLIEGILTPESHESHLPQPRVRLADEYSMGFEGHPNNTTRAHLQTLFDLGFRRVSFGVQDYDSKVQHAINRIQSYEQVKHVTLMAREIGYSSISHDLVFGLPFQTQQSVGNSIEQTAALLPDRLAYYSYAHVPWIKGNGQRGFEDDDLPSAHDKRGMYEMGLEIFEKLGYQEVGMDHFALPTDALAVAALQGGLHRNFMGYTEQHTPVLIGLGVSSISDSWNGFAQNEKDLDTYMQLVANRQLPISRGHLLSAEDLIIREHVLNIMCRMGTSWDDNRLAFPELAQVIERLQPMVDDGLVELGQNRVVVTALGKAFLRNIAMCFDLRLWRQQPLTKLFSMTV